MGKLERCRRALRRNARPEYLAAAVSLMAVLSLFLLPSALAPKSGFGEQEAQTGAAYCQSSVACEVVRANGVEQASVSACAEEDEIVLDLSGVPELEYGEQVFVHVFAGGAEITNACTMDAATGEVRVSADAGTEEVAVRIVVEQKEDAIAPDVSDESLDEELPGEGASEDVEVANNEGEGVAGEDSVMCVEASDEDVGRLHAQAEEAKISLLAAEDASSIPSGGSGRCYVGEWEDFGSDTAFQVIDFDGILSGGVTCDPYDPTGSAWGWCITPGAPRGGHQGATYYASYHSHSVEGGWVCYYVEVIQDQGDAQNIACYVRVKRKMTIEVEVRKESAAPAITDGNAQYSLDGAIFGVYDSREAADADEDGSSALFTLVTDANGTARRDGVKPGTYYTKEIAAPKGYARDDTVQEKSGTSGTLSFEFKDAPLNDPTFIMLKKRDAQTGDAQGKASLEGATYRVRYYDVSGIEDETQLEGRDPLRTWYLRTDANGEITFDEEHKSGGDEFYRNLNGTPCVPLGTLLIDEVEAPCGYYLPGDEPGGSKKRTVFVREITSNGTSGVRDFNTVVASEDVKRYGVSLYKQVQGAEGEVSPEGIAFDVVSKSTGDVVARLVIGVDGWAATENDALPYDAYDIVEDRASLPKDDEGRYLILPWSQTSGTGSDVVASVDFADPEWEPLDVFSAECTDYAPGEVEGKKKDAQGAGVGSAKFALYSLDGCAIEGGRVTEDMFTLDAYDARWARVGEAWSEDDGTFAFESLPFGAYMIFEEVPASGYMGAAETLLGGYAADERAYAHIFKIDGADMSSVQAFIDAAIEVETSVAKRTIAITTAGHEYTGEDGTSVSNIGIERYRYDVEFSAGATNTYADEYWVEDALEMCSDEFGLKVETLWTPVVEGDADGEICLLVKVDGKCDLQSAESLTFSQPGLHEGSVCDGTDRFDGAGWYVVGTYPANAACRVDIGGLLPGAKATSIALCFGAVEQGFGSVSPLSYEVCATRALGEGTILPNSVTSHITRNWSKVAHTPQGDVPQEPGGLEADSFDDVETRVVGTFDVDVPEDSYWGGRGSYTPTTADVILGGVLIILSLACLALCAFTIAVIAEKRRGESGWKK